MWSGHWHLLFRTIIALKPSETRIYWNVFEPEVKMWSFLNLIIMTSELFPLFFKASNNVCSFIRFDCGYFSVSAFIFAAHPFFNLSSWAFIPVVVLQSNHRHWWLPIALGGIQWSFLSYGHSHSPQSLPCYFPTYSRDTAVAVTGSVKCIAFCVAQDFLSQVLLSNWIKTEHTV